MSGNYAVDYEDYRGSKNSSNWSGQYTANPSEMENRFSNEDGIGYMDSIFTEPTEEDMEKIEHIRDTLSLLPSREADFIELYYFRKLRQTDIAIIFKVSQPTVCYRLMRAAARIRYLLNLPNTDSSRMESDLSGFLADPLDVQIMMLMQETTCQSEVAKQLGVSQGLVRHRFLRSLAQMRNHPKCCKYVPLFEYIAENLNILREVQRPYVDEKVYHCIS